MPTLEITGDGGGIIAGSPVTEVLDGLVINGTVSNISGSWKLGGEASILTNIPINITSASGQWQLYGVALKWRPEETA